jgi:glycine betaine/choline ABC-type transport system substrate-binding protein
LVVGSRAFTEQVVLGEIVAQHVEQRQCIVVKRRLNLGDTLLAHQALLTGNIDLYPEYAGAALVLVLKLPFEPDPAIALERARLEYRLRAQCEWLDPLGFTSGFALAIRGADAHAGKLETLSEAAAYTPGWVLGLSPEFLERPDGYRGLMRAYELPLTTGPKSMDPGLLYKALADKQVSMVAVRTTDGALASGDVKVLADDRRGLPPSQAALVVRADALTNYPGLRRTLSELSGKISQAAIRKLNYQVDVSRRPVTQVARQFLVEAGLLR